MERSHIAREAKERAGDDLQRDIHLAIVERERILAEKVSSDDFSHWRHLGCARSTFF